MPHIRLTFGSVLTTETIAFFSSESLPDVGAQRQRRKTIGKTWVVWHRHTASKHPVRLGKSTREISAQILATMVSFLSVNEHYLTYSRRLPKDPPFPPPLSLDDAKVSIQSHTRRGLFH